MRPNFLVRSTIVSSATLIGIVLGATSAAGQAWVPPKGEGAVSVAFQNLVVKDHIATTTRVNAGRIDTNVLLADFTYGVTDKLAVDFALPLVMAKYTGSRPHPGTDIDDGRVHTSFSDLRFSLRFNVVRGGAVLTPYVGTIVPSHDYPFYGHAAPGERLREVQFGVYGAKLFDRGIPGLFVSGRYSFGVVEKVLDISHNRSLADLEVGYFVTPSLRGFAMANTLHTYGGIDLPLGGLPALPPEYRGVHDQIQRVHHLHLGGGASYSLSDSIDVFGSFSRLVSGRNGHALDRGITVGMSWGFSRKKGATSSSAGTEADATDKREGSLGRCICQKGS